MIDVRPCKPLSRETPLPPVIPCPTQNPETEKLRQLWYKNLSKSESMKLYYGNGTVD